MSDTPRPPGRAQAAALLADVAAALTACQAAGLRPRLKHNTVFTAYGYVVPPLSTGPWETWLPRPLAAAPPAPASSED